LPPGKADSLLVLLLFLPLALWHAIRWGERKPFPLPADPLAWLPLAGLDAYKIREEIAARGFEVYDPANIGVGDNAFYTGIDDYRAGNFAVAKNKASEALYLYSQTLKTAWETYTAKMRADATAERQKALDLKADVAVKQDFDAANSVFSQANTAFYARRYEDAGGFYERCLPMFTSVAALALEKRLAAEEALRRANQRVAASDEAARNAERILEGGM
jgi:tetratricopeptide (TPR) repeat protein